MDYDKERQGPDAHEPIEPATTRFAHQASPGEERSRSASGDSPGVRLLSGILEDHEVTEMELRLTSNDLGGAESVVIGADAGPRRRQRRHDADHELFLRLRTCEPSGPMHHVYVMEFCVYGKAIMMMLMRTGEIVYRCATTPRARPRPLPVHHTSDWTFVDRQELADESVTRGLAYFMRHAVYGGEWDPAGPASLKNYFVGACILQFPNVYTAWRTRRSRWEDNPRLVRARVDVPEPASPDATSADAIFSVMRDDLLTRLNALERHVIWLLLDGNSSTGIAAVTGQTPRTVEGIIRRVRRRAARGDFGDWSAS